MKITCWIDAELAVFGCKSIPYSSANGGLFGLWMISLAPAFLLNLFNI